MSYLRSTILSKVVMALTGVLLVGFIAGHTLGNMQVFLGREAYNTYADMLQSMGEFLWIIRGALFLALVLHIITSVRLKLLNNKTGGSKYAVKNYMKAKLTSRTMIWTGIMIFAFVAYHLAHFTIGYTNPDTFAKNNLEYYPSNVVEFEKVNCCDKIKQMNEYHAQCEAEKKKACDGHKHDAHGHDGHGHDSDAGHVHKHLHKCDANCAENCPHKKMHVKVEITKDDAEGETSEEPVEVEVEVTEELAEAETAEETAEVDVDIKVNGKDADAEDVVVIVKKKCDGEKGHGEHGHAGHKHAKRECKEHKHAKHHAHHKSAEACKADCQGKCCKKPACVKTCEGVFVADEDDKMMFSRPDVYNMVIKDFQDPILSIAYIIGVILMGFHLSHAIQSMFQTLGFNHPKYFDKIVKWSNLFSIFLVLCLISIPISILLGFGGGCV